MKLMRSNCRFTGKPPHWGSTYYTRWVLRSYNLICAHKSFDLEDYLGEYLRPRFSTELKSGLAKYSPPDSKASIQPTHKQTEIRDEKIN